MTIDADFWRSLIEQGIDLAEVGLPYGRRAYPGLDTMAPDTAYKQGFLDGLRAVQALVPLVTIGPTYDPAEFIRRIYDPDVLPIVEPSKERPT